MHAQNKINKIKVIYNWCDQTFINAPPPPSFYKKKPLFLFVSFFFFSYCSFPYRDGVRLLRRDGRAGVKSIPEMVSRLSSRFTASLALRAEAEVERFLVVLLGLLLTFLAAAVELLFLAEPARLGDLDAALLGDLEEPRRTGDLE